MVFWRTFGYIIFLYHESVGFIQFYQTNQRIWSLISITNVFKYCKKNFYIFFIKKIIKKTLKDNNNMASLLQSYEVLLSI